MSTIDDRVRARAEARVGTTIGAYSLERLVGLGATAAVYEAHTACAHVALKVLHRELAEDGEVAERLLREALTANRIAHPGVVRVLDHARHADGTAFLALELCRGRTVEEEWRGGGRRLAPKRTVEIARAVLDVLAVAHAAGIVHRDLKPSNVFALTDGAIKVLDFGLARVHDHPRGTRSGDLVGSAEFASPEQARGRGRSADERSDVYSVGAMMFTLLSGRFVHEAQSPLERIILTATRSARSVRLVVPEIGDRLADAIDGAMAFERAHRWSSALAMRDALDGAL